MLTEQEIHKIAAVEASHWWYRGMREIFFDMLAPHVAGSSPLRILDVGCGTGGNLLELSKLGEAHGTDLDPLCVEYCRRKGLSCTLSDMSAVTASPGSFDLVTMFDVLSQAEGHETESILSGVAQVLSPGGLLALREPAMPFAAGAHDRAVGVRQRFTTSGLAAILGRAGFEIRRMTYLNTLLFPPIVAARRLQVALRPDVVASDVRVASGPMNGTLLGVLRLEKQLLRVMDLPFGVSIFAVARKAGPTS